MKLIGDSADVDSDAGDCGGGGGGRTVVVGVKLDSRSRELLTWALVKVAEPGDLVIALHVLDTITGPFLSLSLAFSFTFVLSCVKPDIFSRCRGYWIASLSCKYF